MAGRELEIATGTLTANLREHEICFVVPAGATINANLDNPGGVLILGRYSGKLRCARGSLIIGPGAEFMGTAEADSIYVQGTVRPTRSNGPSLLKGRMLVAISEIARGQADLLSRAFAIHTRDFAARFATITD